MSSEKVTKICHLTLLKNFPMLLILYNADGYFWLGFFKSIPLIPLPLQKEGGRKREGLRPS
jgi:hypothetical protein